MVFGKPRTGPQGATNAKIMDVIQRGSAAIPKTTTPAPTQRKPFDIQEFVRNIVGGPVPAAAAGKKRAGYDTQEQLKSAIVGGIDPVDAIMVLAAEKAQREQLAADIAQENRLVDIYGPSAATVDRTRPGWQQREAAMTQYETTPSGLLRPSQYTVGIENEPAVRAALAQTGGWTPQTPMVKESQLGEMGRDMMQQYMNALVPSRTTRPATLTTPAPGGGGDAAALALATRNAVSQRRAQELAANQRYQRELEQNVMPNVELAEGLSNIPRYELARQIAMSRYNIDPALAAGMFQPSMEQDFTAELLARQNAFPGESLEEYIGRTQGAEALNAYQQSQYEAAMAKQAEGARTAEEEAFDLELTNRTGIPVEVAAGDLPLAKARQLLTDDVFMGYVNDARAGVMAYDATSAEEKKNEIRRQVAYYYDQTGDPAIAKVLENILVYFDFLLGYQT